MRGFAPEVAAVLRSLYAALRALAELDILVAQEKAHNGKVHSRSTCLHGCMKDKVLYFETRGAD